MQVIHTLFRSVDMRQYNVILLALQWFLDLKAGACVSIKFVSPAPVMKWQSENHAIVANVGQISIDFTTQISLVK